MSFVQIFAVTILLYINSSSAVSDTEFKELKDELFFIKIGVFILIASVFLIAFVSINVLLKVLCSRKQENNSQGRKQPKMISNNFYYSVEDDPSFMKQIGNGMTNKIITEENTYDELKPKSSDNLDEYIEYEEVGPPTNNNAYGVFA